MPDVTNETESAGVEDVEMNKLYFGSGVVVYVMHREALVDADGKNILDANGKQILVYK
jgi:hypothetical protein